AAIHLPDCERMICGRLTRLRIKPTRCVESVPDRGLRESRSSSTLAVQHCEYSLIPTSRSGLLCNSSAREQFLHPRRKWRANDHLHIARPEQRDIIERVAKAHSAHSAIDAAELIAQEPHGGPFVDRIRDVIEPAALGPCFSEF